jgi:hypothetical protein
VVSFLEFKIRCHWTIFETMVSDAISSGGRQAGFAIETLYDGDVPHMQVPYPVQIESGTMISGETSLGQSVRVNAETLIFRCRYAFLSDCEAHSRGPVC